MSIYDVKIIYTNGDVDELTVEEADLYKDLDVGDYMALKAFNGNVMILNMQQVSRIGFSLVEE